jgi:hypothetical protein
MTGNPNILFSAGVFFVTTGTLLMYQNTKKNSRFSADQKTKQAFFINELQFRKNKAIQKLKANRKLLLTNMAIAILFAVGAGRTAIELNRYFSMGFILSMAASCYLIKLQKGIKHNRKMKDIAVLFEAVELYMKAGYSMYQAIMLSRALVPRIRKEIDICLDYWTAGPRKALEKFKEALDIEGGEILVSLLIHMEMAGIKDLQGILTREATNIERLRRMRNEIKLSIRPIYMMVYRFLPLGAVIGIITGPLLYRTYAVLKDANLLIF